MNRDDLILNKGNKSFVAEAYRVLRTNVLYSSIDKKIQTIAVTSTGPGEGKSSTVANFAIALAHAGSKVLVIDADLRKPRIHKTFRLSNKMGLTNIIVEGLDWKEHIRTIEELPLLNIITSGPIPPNPSELCGSVKMKNFVESLREAFDYIIIDTPPAGVVTDGTLISSYVDGTILVVSSGNVEIEAVKRTKNLLTNVNANILGVVLNKIPTNDRGYYKYYYYSYYHEDETGNKKKKKKVKAQAND